MNFTRVDSIHCLYIVKKNRAGDISLSGLGRDWTLRRYILHLNDI